jgi:hypothetical protein
MLEDMSVVGNTSPIGQGEVAAFGKLRVTFTGLKFSELLHSAKQTQP